MKKAKKQKPFLRRETANKPKTNTKPIVKFSTIKNRKEKA
jgi:hypothetical protein